MENQAINFNAILLGGYADVFLKVVLAIVAVYVIIIVMNFLRDKFINKEVNLQKVEITDLLTILHKLFFISGFGFIIGNLVQKALEAISMRGHQMKLAGDWDYLTFGIILFFMGVGFKSGKKVVRKENMEQKQI